MVDPASVSADHPAVVKLEKAGAHPMELAAFRRRLAQLADAGAGTLPGDELSPVEPLPRLDDLPEPDEATTRAVLDRLAVVKLNGGLGTSMGLDGPKSTLEIKPGRSFLDVIAIQTLALRRSTGARLPLLLMDSPTTRPPSLARLRAHEGLDDQPLPLDFLQGIEPKLEAATHEPVEWPADPQLEWCPPGHGDIYTALAASGIAATLLEAGVRWCFVSNADNLGARPDPRIAAWLAEREVPFLLEVVRGTESDRKGGHLAMRDGRLVLRESAQVPDGDPSFGDLSRWHYFNTNNIWFDLEAIAALQEADPAAPELPLIVNRKTVDPTDKSSTPVLQLETAMGAADLDDRRCGCTRGAAHPVRPGEDDRRPPGGALGPLGAARRRCDGAALRRHPARGLAGQGPLRNAARLRGALPGRRAVAGGRASARGARGRDLRRAGDGARVGERRRAAHARGRHARGVSPVPCCARGTLVRIERPNPPLPSGMLSG